LLVSETDEVLGEGDVVDRLVVAGVPEFGGEFVGVTPVDVALGLNEGGYEGCPSEEVGAIGCEGERGDSAHELSLARGIRGKELTP
jgi:hypothetical protein